MKIHHSTVDEVIVIKTIEILRYEQYYSKNIKKKLGNQAAVNKDKWGIKTNPLHNSSNISKLTVFWYIQLRNWPHQVEEDFEMSKDKFT